MKTIWPSMTAAPSAQRAQAPRRLWPGALLAVLASVLWSPSGASAQGIRVKEIASVQGVRSNQLTGYGLVVAGEKQIGVNQNVDVLRFSGTVDPRQIQPGNVIPSIQVANARIESRGRGAQGEALSIGWLARFFLSVIPF